MPEYTHTPESQRAFEQLPQPDRDVLKEQAWDEALNIEAAAQDDSKPEASPETEFAKEVEVKILDIGSAEEFEQRVAAAGGKKETERSLIQDESFKKKRDAVVPSITARIDEDTSGENPVVRLHWQAGEQEMSVVVPDSADRLEKVLQLLGISLNGKTSTNIDKRTVRFRSEHDAVTWTVKAPRKKEAAIDDRPEQEVTIGDPEAIRSLLSLFGYSTDAVMEKYRTHYSIQDCDVVVDEYPGVPPYAEVEGPSHEQVFQIVQALGYSTSNTDSMTVKDYLRRSGVHEDQLHEIRFPQEDGESKSHE